MLLEEFSKCFDNDKYRYKQQELMALANILDETPDQDPFTGESSEEDDSL